MTRRTSFSAALICLLVLVARGPKPTGLDRLRFCHSPFGEARPGHAVDRRRETVPRAGRGTAHQRALQPRVPEIHDAGAWPTRTRTPAAIAIGWNWIEPQKGKYDFKILDAMIEDARQIDQRICPGVVRKLEKRRLQLRARLGQGRPGSLPARTNRGQDGRKPPKPSPPSARTTGKRMPARLRP